ncbi:MAG: hypothetical protein Fur0010_12890 [Bdellovibrio sp.]
MDEVWKIAANSMQVAHRKHPILLHAFVLMSNHYHLVLETPDSNIDLFMYEFNKNFSLEMRKATGKINRMFGGRYKWSLITEDRYYLNVMKYVFTNPVRANIVKNVCDYPYSTLVNSIDAIPLKKMKGWNQPEWLNWFQNEFTDRQRNSIKSGFRNKHFKFANVASLKRPPEFCHPS